MPVFYILLINTFTFIEKFGYYSVVVQARTSVDWGENATAVTKRTKTDSECIKFFVVPVYFFSS